MLGGDGPVRLFQSGQGEQILDDRADPLGMPDDPTSEVGTVLGWDLGVEQSLGEATDGGQRRLQLVRDVGDELGPHPAQTAHEGQIRENGHHASGPEALCCHQHRAPKDLELALRSVLGNRARTEEAHQRGVAKDRRERASFNRVGGADQLTHLRIGPQHHAFRAQSQDALAHLLKDQFGLGFLLGEIAQLPLLRFGQPVERTVQLARVAGCGLGKPLRHLTARHGLGEASGTADGPGKRRR